jgi:hypothetical protein
MLPLLGGQLIFIARGSRIEQRLDPMVCMTGV